MHCGCPVDGWPSASTMLFLSKPPRWMLALAVLTAE